MQTLVIQHTCGSTSSLGDAHLVAERGRHVDERLLHRRDVLQRLAIDLHALTRLGDNRLEFRLKGLRCCKG